MDKKYRVTCYIRVDPDEYEPMSLEEAESERDHCKFLQPENIYGIERIDEAA